MRINKFVALSSNLSRRQADAAIAAGRVQVNGQPAETGQEVGEVDTVTLDSQVLRPQATLTIMLNKPAGYVVSRDGQGSKTIYELLPPAYQHLQPVGRLDKDSSGLLLLTNDGELANQLTHPRWQKEKIYEVVLDKPLTPADQDKIQQGVLLEDGLSKLQLERLKERDDTAWKVIMHEGRNRQIRRTFAALGHNVRSLHRTHFGPYYLTELSSGESKLI